MTIKLTEEEFETQYQPKQKPDGNYFEWVDVKDLPAERVWTVVETGDPVNDSWYALPGFRIVNKIGYLVSDTPWTDDDIEALWFSSWPELQNYDPHHRRYVVYFPGMGETFYIKVKRNGEVRVRNDAGDDFADELRATLGDDDYEYLTGEYLRLVAEAYANAFVSDESEAETRAAQVAAMNIPVIREEDQ